MGRGGRLRRVGRARASAVGVGGSVTGGGIGWLVRSASLTTHHVIEYQVVLADGTIVTANADCEPDLFGALKGAGGSNLRRHLRPARGHRRRRG